MQKGFKPTSPDNVRLDSYSHTTYNTAANHNACCGKSDARKGESKGSNELDDACWRVITSSGS